MLYANTKKQELYKHLFAVGYLAYKLTIKLTNNEKLALASYVAGCLHDIGKTDPAFKAYIPTKLAAKKEYDNGAHIQTRNFSFEKYPRHNEISLLLYQLMENNDERSLNTSLKLTVGHVLYWHHARPKREEPFNDLGIIYKRLIKNNDEDVILNMMNDVEELLIDIHQLEKDYLGQPISNLPNLLIKKFNKDDAIKLDNVNVPKYKSYNNNVDLDGYKSDSNLNTNNNIIRSIVIMADRLVSSMSNEDLIDHINNKTLDSLIESFTKNPSNLMQDIKVCLNGFPDNKRSKQQTLAVSELADIDDVSVLNGPAGCGKTKVGLDWAYHKNAQQIIWICPRVQICQGLVKDLTSDAYLPHSKIEINTGEFKFIYQNGAKIKTPINGAFTGDIVLTTIDQISNAIVSTNDKIRIIDFMNTHIIFDEYHEYVNLDGYNLLFKELINIKQLQPEANTLLVSATPNYYFTEEFLEIDDIVNLDSFNESKYKIVISEFDENEFNEQNPLYKLQPDNTFVISNTATSAQRSFMANQLEENAILLHSKFTKLDGKRMFEEVYNTFKENGTGEYDILRSGPKVQASLNISCDNMVTEFTTAENTLQRIGRLDRFGKNKQNICEFAVPFAIVNGNKSACKNWLAKLNSFNSAKAWHDFILPKINHELSIAQLYRLYYDFCHDTNAIDAIEEDFMNALKKSVELLSSELETPIEYAKKRTSSTKLNISDRSLRGKSRFVQMAIYEANDNNMVSNQYAYNETENEDFLTMGLDKIRGFSYDDTDRDLLAYMKKKHHRIKNITKPFTTTKLENSAKNPELPIYLSYTPDDLSIINEQPDEFAIYYVIGYNNPIGHLPSEYLLTNS